MATDSLKTLAVKVLQRNFKGNSAETSIVTQSHSLQNLTAEQQEALEERVAIMRDSGLPEDEAATLAYHCIRPIPFTFVESCQYKTPPEGDCKRYSMKLYKPTMSLKQYCLNHKKWCYEVVLEELSDEAM